MNNIMSYQTQYGPDFVKTSWGVLKSLVWTIYTLVVIISMVASFWFVFFKMLAWYIPVFWVVMLFFGLTVANMEHK